MDAADGWDYYFPCMYVHHMTIFCHHPNSGLGKNGARSYYRDLQYTTMFFHTCFRDSCASSVHFSKTDFHFR